MKVPTVAVALRHFNGLESLQKCQSVWYQLAEHGDVDPALKASQWCTSSLIRLRLMMTARTVRECDC